MHTQTMFATAMDVAGDKKVAFLTEFVSSDGRPRSRRREEQAKAGSCHSLVIKTFFQSGMLYVRWHFGLFFFAIVTSEVVEQLQTEEKEQVLSSRDCPKQGVGSRDCLGGIALLGTPGGRSRRTCLKMKRFMIRDGVTVDVDVCQLA